VVSSDIPIKLLREFLILPMHSTPYIYLYLYIYIHTHTHIHMIAYKFTEGLIRNIFLW